MNTEASDYSVTHPPRWMHRVLIAAGFYNLLWGAFVIVFPAALFRMTAIPAPMYPQIWQCVGMIVGVYGIGYLISAADPVRHWPIVLVGFLGKTLGPIGFVASAIQGDLPWTWGLTIITNDLIWWLPFAGILYHSLRHHTNTSNSEEPHFADIIRTVASQNGATLDDLSRQKPTLVVLLRHSGCTFCRETLSDLSENRERIENAGVELAVVHMSQPTEAEAMFARYQLGDLHRYSDPR